MFAIPSEAHEISHDDLTGIYMMYMRHWVVIYSWTVSIFMYTDYFPDDETLQAWKHGEEEVDIIGAVDCRYVIDCDCLCDTDDWVWEWWWSLSSRSASSALLSISSSSSS